MDAQYQNEFKIHLKEKKKIKNKIVIEPPHQQ